jgi:hypothetical protein
MAEPQVPVELQLDRARGTSAIAAHPISGLSAYAIEKRDMFVAPGAPPESNGDGRHEAAAAADDSDSPSPGFQPTIDELGELEAYPTYDVIDIVPPVEVTPPLEVAPPADGDGVSSGDGSAIAASLRLRDGAMTPPPAPMVRPTVGSSAVVGSSNGEGSRRAVTGYGVRMHHPGERDVPAARGRRGRQAVLMSLGAVALVAALFWRFVDLARVLGPGAPAPAGEAARAGSSGGEAVRTSAGTVAADTIRDSPPGAPAAPRGATADSAASAGERANVETSTSSASRGAPPGLNLAPLPASGLTLSSPGSTSQRAPRNRASVLDTIAPDTGLQRQRTSPTIFLRTAPPPGIATDSIPVRAPAHLLFPAGRATPRKPLGARARRDSLLIHDSTSTPKLPAP